MEKLVKESLYEESLSYQLLGGERQTLQAVLLPGQSIVTKSDAVLLSSDNVALRNLTPSIFRRLISLVQMKPSQHLDLEIKNESGAIAYANMQRMKGRIVIIDNEITPKMIVREKYVLARTANVELIPSWSHMETLSSVGLKQIKAKKPPL